MRGTRNTRQIPHLDQNAQIRHEATRLAYMTDEAKEGRNAFLEKRKPDFRRHPEQVAHHRSGPHPQPLPQ